MKDDSVYLQHILHCIQRIEEDSSKGYEFFLVHNYLGVDLDVVWDVVKRDIPTLKQVVLSMLASL